MVCLHCEVKEATHLKRQLCGSCYQMLMRENLLYLFPTIKDRLVRKNNAPEVMDLYQKLFDDPTLTLADIGNVLGYSRERARQVFFQIFGFRFTALKNKRTAERVDRLIREVQERQNPRYKVAHCKNLSSFVGKGAIGEEKVLEVCERLNYTVIAYKNRSIDLVINGFAVDVKTAFKSAFFARGQKTACYRFRISDSQHEADFVICYVAPQSKYFIIPQSAFPKCGCIYIPEKRSHEWTMKGRKQISNNKYYTYLEAWHLLKPQADVVSFANCGQPNSRDFAAREAGV